MSTFCIQSSAGLLSGSLEAWRDAAAFDTGGEANESDFGGDRLLRLDGAGGGCEGASGRRGLIGRNDLEDVDV